MQFRRLSTLLVPALLGLAGAVSIMLGAMPASADVVLRNSVKEMELRQKISLARSAKLRTAAGADPETVWVGHVSTGGYGPHKIGRGPNRIIGGNSGPASSFDGVWDFDHLQGGETDSLQGWWPIQGPFGSVGPSDLDDWKRSWFGLDYGNQANYVIPQGAPKRTFGVTGIWHADAGNAAVTAIPGSNPVAPGWAPITGAKSMWCGVRGPGDITALDATGTGNAINSDLAQFQGNNSGRQVSSARVQGTDHNFPGYGSQWDQILYRDVNFGANANGNVTVSFKYTTHMSQLFYGTHASQTGYFYFDPLKQAGPPSTGTDGNFISAALSAAGPVDSFMVYVGAPVEPVAGGIPNDFVASDGLLYDVYDVQRRWFSEVIKTTNAGGAPGSGPYRQLLSLAGVNGTTAAPLTFSTALTQAQVNAILDADGGAGNGGRLRLVFRVKTNRGFDDENTGNGAGYTSGGAGAAIIDDVSVSGGGATALTEGFEGTNGGVDNGTGVAATAAWKSTGKPPGAWFHLHNAQTGGLPFEDPCGAIAAPVRLCNMGGNVLSPGNHELGDKTGGVFGSNTQDQWKYAVSPTINLVSSGVGNYNGMGIDTEIASRIFQLWGDQLVNVYDYATTGNGFRYGWQAYPSTQPNGSKTWGEMTKTIYFYSTSVPAGCFGGGIGFLDQPNADHPIITTNTNGIPDSIRVYIEAQSRCFTLPLTSSQCSPNTGAQAGGYFDNLSMAFITAPPPPALGFSIWDVFNDCFPVNSQSKAFFPFGVGSDTLAARIQTGYNTALPASNDITGPNARENIPGDSTVVSAQDVLTPGGAQPTRCDLIFRILPGVGNYVTLGTPGSGVARRPDVSPRVAATVGDPGNGGLTAVDKFWGAYMADNGAFGTGGNGATGPGHPGGVWDKNRWNSARMDTLEVNLFPEEGVAGNDDTAALTPGTYMSYYNEQDPKYTVLGIVKNRCFIQKNKQPVKLDASNINCGSLGGGGNPYPPDWTALPGSGFNPNEVTGLPGRTREFTKILPDGQFTPGTSIQYFYRKAVVADPFNATYTSIVPDTNFTFNDTFDPHRWLEVSVLPDRWKGYGGSMACMLVVDLGDGRGDEIAWVSMADSIGLTEPGKRGSDNGWRARPDQSILGNIGGDDTIARRDHGGHAGSMWDKFDVVAGESNVPAGRLGSRAAAKNNQGSSLTQNKWSTHGPSEDMVKIYRTMVVLGADLGPDAIGPLPNQTDDDILVMSNFLTLPGGSPQPRALMMTGYRAGEALALQHPSFLSVYFRATLRHTDYRQLSGNTNDAADLLVQPAAGGTTAPQTYGFGNQCFLTNDVFNAEAAAPAGQAGTLYENVGGGAPYVAAVYAPTSGLLRNYITMINGWTFGAFGGGFGTETTLLNVGVRKYMYDLLTNAFGGLSCQPTGTPVGVGDGPGSVGSAFVNFMNLKSANPMRSREARIGFGLAKTERVEIRVYDVTGRMVKTVANRTFAGGQEHVVTWDGTDEVGNKVKSGVYFYQLKTATWVSQKKLAVLTN